MAIGISLASVYIAAVVYRQDWPKLVYACAWAIALPLAWTWGNVVVDAVGIRLSWFERRRLNFPTRWIAWDQVESVEKFDHSRTYVHIRLTDGRTVPLIGIQGERSEAVAALGTKPLMARRLASITMDRPRTAEQVDAELRQREAALAAEREELKRISEGMPRVPRQLRRSE
ncbi:PH domain-containing protein [Cryptosporangium arvum]|uniref:PH domain-containing protein n=1 Tax=Cryptosporangium arvum TaxID=80871 RepID=UPI0014702D15|nr:PH domain-containing protein [Cryptosporangium arvum]